jgi:CheY-like chemotaxis protein
MVKQCSFLLVDDDPDDTFLFGEVLHDVDPSIELRTAANGQEALDLLKGMPSLPDLIFLDLNMPRMGGVECLSLLKADEALKYIPVIIYTTSSQSKDIEETIQKGAVCFITKPSNMKGLTEILLTICRSLPANLEDAIRSLSTKGTHFIIC